MPEKLVIGSDVIAPGQRRKIDLPLARLYDRTEMTTSIEVLHSRRPGPSLFLSAALHGDEVNGMEIIRRVLNRLDVSKMRGTLIAVPIVNVFAFIYQSRYLPDRRDLNRSFPGSANGSLAARTAHLFLTEVVSRCQYGIDLHTAAPPRSNLPQIRANLRDEETRRLSAAFGAPVMIQGAAPKGSLRSVAVRRGIRILLYEAGEPLRFNEGPIADGVEGVLRVMRQLGMLMSGRIKRHSPSLEATKTRWLRARQSGILRLNVKLGNTVEQGHIVGVIANVFGDEAHTLKAPMSGLIIGQTHNPLVHRGDALLHFAQVGKQIKSAPTVLTQ